MTESIASLKEQLIELHQRVDNAEIFQSLYQRVGELIEKVPSQKRTSYEPPADDRRYLKNEMSAIELQILEKEPLDQAQKTVYFIIWLRLIDWPEKAQGRQSMIYWDMRWSVLKRSHVGQTMCCKTISYMRMSWSLKIRLFLCGLQQSTCCILF